MWSWFLIRKLKEFIYFYKKRAPHYDLERLYWYAWDFLHTRNRNVERPTLRFEAFVLVGVGLSAQVDS